MFLGFWNVCTKFYNFFYRGGGADFGVLGAPHAPTRGSRGVGKRYTSSYDHDMWPVKILEWSGLAVKSYHPETLAAEEEKKKKKKNWQNHKAFPAGSRECLINRFYATASSACKQLAINIYVTLRHTGQCDQFIYCNNKLLSVWLLWTFIPPVMKTFIPTKGYNETMHICVKIKKNNVLAYT